MPLFGASADGHVEVVRLLLEKGANINTAKVTSSGWMPLSGASANGHVEVVRLLLEKGADIDTADEDGQTPLSWAAEKGHAAVVTLLQQYKGANTTTANSETLLY